MTNELESTEILEMLETIIDRLQTSTIFPKELKEFLDKW